MTTDDQQDTTAKVSAPELSPGKMLATARERAGLSQDQVAGDLYMTLTKVRALENDEYHRLHSDTFIRGYIRAYANLLKINADAVMAAYDKEAQRLGLVEVFVPKAAEGNGKKTWLIVVLVGLVLLVLWLISVWFFGNKKEPDYPLPAALVLPEPKTVEMEITSSTSASVADNSDQIGATQTLPAATDAVSATATPNQVASAATSSARAYDPTANLDELVFIFAEECWLEVSDAQGDVLATQLEPAGSQVVIKGRAPFDVKLGNVQGVSITLNGREVKFTPVRGTNVRSLKIGN